MLVNYGFGGDQIMKKMLMIFTLILALLLTSCTATVDKGKKLSIDREYDKAIEVFNKVIDKDETNYEAWLGIVKAQVKDDEYDDAEDTLKDLYEVLDENYDEDSDVDYESIFEDFQRYAEDIIEEEGSIGSWYEKLYPSYVDISGFDSMTYEIGNDIKLEIPKDLDLYYNLDGDTVNEKDQKYKDLILLDNEGSFTLSVAAINKFGFVGPTNYAYFTVAKMPDAPSIDSPSGTYDSPLIVHFGDYDSDKFTIYYTLDGSDPVNGYSYYDYDGVRIPTGNVQLRALVYDYYSDLYSPELTVDYVVEAAAAPIASAPTGSYTAPFTLQFSGFDSYDATIFYTLDGSDPIDESLSSYFDPYSGLTLEKGEYEVRAVIYDYNTSDYSKEFTGRYLIN